MRSTTGSWAMLPMLHLLLSIHEAAGLNLPQNVSAIATSGITNIPASGTGSAYAHSCNTAKWRWANAGSGTTTVGFYTTTITQVLAHVSYSESTTTITNFAAGATPFTLCDGYPRIDGNTTVSATLFAQSSPYTTTTIELKPLTSTVAGAPSCSIQSGDCADLSSSYSVYSTSRDAYFTFYESSIAASKPLTTTVPSPSPVSSPLCGTSQITYQTGGFVGSGGAPVCFVNQATVQLFYWPVATASGCDLCHLGACGTTTIAQTIPGEANTFVAGNTTFTSPTVYISLGGTFVYTTSGATLTAATGLILPQSSASVSSLCAQPGGKYLTQSIDYANLNNPVPADAYRCQPSCYSDGDTQNLCSTIYNEYAPALSIPTAFSSLAPSIVYAPGVTCRFTFDQNQIFFDPPSALSSASMQAAATLPGFLTPTTTPPTQVTSVSAAPVAASSTPSMPQATAAPQTSPASGNGPSQSSADSPPPDSAQSSFDVASLSATAGPSVAVSDSDPTPTSFTTENPFASLGSFIASGTGLTAGPASSAAAAASTSANMVAPVAQTITAGKQTFTAVPITLSSSTSAVASGFSIALGVTLTPGGVVTISGATISLNSAGNLVVVNGATQTLAAATVAAAAPTFTAAGQTFTAAAVTAAGPAKPSPFSIAPGVTLAPGGAVTLAGATISLNSAGNQVVVNGVTQTLATATTVAASAALSSSPATGSTSRSQSTSTKSTASTSLTPVPAVGAASTSWSSTTSWLLAACAAVFALGVRA